MHIVDYLGIVRPNHAPPLTPQQQAVLKSITASEFSAIKAVCAKETRPTVSQEAKRESRNS